MVTMPPDAPITRREFHMELMIVWLFVVLIAGAALNDRPRWSAVLIPVFALFMVGVHALTLRRGTPKPPTTGKDVV